MKGLMALKLPTNNLRFVDDILIAKNPQELQAMVKGTTCRKRKNGFKNEQSKN